MPGDRIGDKSEAVVGRRYADEHKGGLSGLWKTFGDGVNV